MSTEFRRMQARASASFKPYQSFIMRQKIFPLLYFTGFLSVALSALRPTPHVYHLIMTQKTWADAQKYCRENYVDLATVSSTDDWLNLEKEEKNYSFSSLAWVGLYNDINSWHWSYKNAPLKIKNWYAGEPNLIGIESCGALDNTGYWWVLNCLLLKPFLCYNASYSGRFIGISDTFRTWLDAQAYCRQYHTDLATSDNETDNSLLKALVIGSSSAWFGLFRDTWKWSDQSNPSSINWLLGPPDNIGGNDNCGSVSVDHIIENNCIKLFPFFCHTIPPVKEIQIVKVLVASAQNMNDPAKESSAWEMIQQQLRAQGMAENTTVTWRLQSDGNVFYEMKEKGVESFEGTFTDCLKPK